MNTFKFSMQRLLDAKEAFERAAEMSLAENQRRLNGIKEQLKAVKQYMKAKVAGFEDSMRAKRGSSELSGHVQYLTWLDKEESRILKDIEKCESEVETARGKLIVVMRQRKSIEKLREKERRDWAINSRRKEQAMADEASSVGYYRKGINLKESEARS